MAITNFTPKTFTNDGGEPINATNLNEMQKVLDALNNGAYSKSESDKLNQQGVSNAVEQAKTFTRNYKQPWDLSGFVTCIHQNNVYNYRQQWTPDGNTSLLPRTASEYFLNNTNPSTREYYLNGPKSITRSIELPLITSGKIAVTMHYALYLGAIDASIVDAVLDKNATKIQVYLNNNIVKTYTFGSEGFVYKANCELSYTGEYSNPADITLHLDVKDSTSILKVETTLKLVDRLPDNLKNSNSSLVSIVEGDIGFTRVGIYANIDTPYKYLTLPFDEKINGQLFRSVR